MQTYLRLGLKLTKICLILEFNQWLKEYVKFNTRKIIEAGKDGYNHEKAQYSFMNNVVYGKTMKKIRNRIDVELLNKNKKSQMDIQTKLFVTQNPWQ